MGCASGSSGMEAGSYFSVGSAKGDGSSFGSSGTGPAFGSGVGNSRDNYGSESMSYDSSYVTPTIDGSAGMSSSFGSASVYESELSKCILSKCSTHQMGLANAALVQPSQILNSINGDRVQRDAYDCVCKNCRREADASSQNAP